MATSTKTKPCGYFYQGMVVDKFVLDEYLETAGNDEKWLVHLQGEPIEQKKVVTFHLNKEMMSRAARFKHRPNKSIIERLPEVQYKAGDKFKQWRLHELLAQESTGEVWSAMSSEGKDDTVIKIATTQNEEKFKSYPREIAALKKCQGLPGAIPLYDYSLSTSANTSEPTWLAMPKVRPYIKTIDTTTPPELMISIIFKTAKVIQRFLDADVAYSDLKSNHICLFNDEVVLIDYGQCRTPVKNVLELQTQSGNEDKPSLTRYHDYLVSQLLNALIGFFEQAGLSDAFIAPFVNAVKEHKPPYSIEAFIDKLEQAIDQGQRFLTKPTQTVLQKAAEDALNWQRAGKLDAAKRTLNEIISFIPQYAQGYHLLSIIALQQVNYPLALTLINKAIALSESPQAIYYSTLGDVESHLKHIPEAVAAYEKALSLNPKFAGALNNLGVTHLREQNRQKGQQAQQAANLKAVEQFDSSLKQQLLSACQNPTALTPISAAECRMLYAGQVDADAGKDSYETISWDQYFSDLSHGSYRIAHDREHRAVRLRTWHYLWKNLNIIHQLYQHQSQQLKICDIGCSSGYFRRFLEGNFSELEQKQISYYGVDVRLDMLLRAVHLTADLESGAEGKHIPSLFLQHDLKYPLPFGDQEFDVVLNLECIKYLPIEQGRALLSECCRILKPEGKLYCSTTYNLNHPGYIESVNYSEFAKLIQEQGLEILNQVGSQAQAADIFKHLKPEHKQMAQTLLQYHPPEIVATLLTPFYPNQATQVTYICTR